MQPISQQEYVTYAECIKDIKVVGKLLDKDEPLMIYSDYNEKRVIPSNEYGFNPDTLDKFKNRIDFINRVHQKLEVEMNKRAPDDCASLVIRKYNTNLKNMEIWNKVFVKKNIPAVYLLKTKLEPSFTDKTTDQIEDERALKKYSDYLTKFPKLNRELGSNDHTKGAYEIYHEKEDIERVRKVTYNRLYTKSIGQGFSSSESHALAVKGSRIGVVWEDQYWLWIRDSVINPQGVEHTYNRMVQKSDLDRPGGVAALPITITSDGKKIILQLAHRHATCSFEMEIPRGSSKPSETPVDTALREVKEETGYVCDKNNLLDLNCIAVDSGLTASVIPIFMGIVQAEEETKHDKTEAIQGKYAFTFEQIKEGYAKGYLDVHVNGEMKQIPFRDPFTDHALLAAIFQGHFDDELSHMLLNRNKK